MASRVVGRAYDVALKSAGINIVQFSILVTVSRLQPVPQIQLADNLDMERTTLYRALDILARQGLIRQESVGEGMAKQVRLTPAGKDAVSKAEKRWAILHEDFLKKFGARRLQEFLESLSEIRDHFREL